MTPPLTGVRIIEFAGIGPGPYAGQLLADMGADVILVDRPSRGPVGFSHAVERRGKRSVVLDLRRPEGVALALDLIAGADAVIEGLRPGVTERLGLGPEACRARNPALVYGRMTGWGQDGPWASMAGHDINYIGLTGALLAIGEADRPPPPPLNLIGDFGGGSLFLAMGVLAALIRARATGAGEVVDAAICDATWSMLGMFQTMDAAGAWTPRRADNMLDGAAPFYRCYAASDGGFLAVGCLEPQFFAEMLRLLDIDPADFGDQWDRALWPGQRDRLAALFAERPRAAWEALFVGTDACVTPALDYREAPHHPHMAARRAAATGEGLVHPAPAPRFASTGIPSTPPAIPADGAHSAEVLASLGLSPDRIQSLADAGVTRLADPVSPGAPAPDASSPAKG